MDSYEKREHKLIETQQHKKNFIAYLLKKET